MDTRDKLTSVTVKKEDKYQVANYFSRKNKFWNTVYQEVSAGDSFINSHMQMRKEKVFAYLNSFANDSTINVLDVGCGSGLSFTMTKDASIKLSNFNQQLSETICGDIDRLPFPDSYFDAVICVGVLEYLEDEQNTLQELYRVLKPQGAIIFTLPNRYKIKNLLDPYYYLVRIWQYLFKKLGFKKKVNDELFKFSTNESFTNKRYTLKKLKTLIKKSKLQLVDFSSIGFGPLTLWKKAFLPLKLSLIINNFFETITAKYKIPVLQMLPNRWVIYSRKK
jgi:ubiquinone/menaquinone biosynthesis C-methylase UbiE